MKCLFVATFVLVSLLDVGARSPDVKTNKESDSAGKSTEHRDAPSEEAGVFLTYTLTDHGGRSKVKLLISLQSNFDLGYSNQWTKNRAKELEMKVCIPN